MATSLRIHSPLIVYFDAIRRAGSIRAAARRLNIASSAVNRQLLRLEAEIGTPLFERLPQGLKLTAAGEVLARHTLVVLQDSERARSELDALKGLQAGHVELATVEGVCADLLPAALAVLRQRHPRISVGVAIQGSELVPASILSGQADIGFAFGLSHNAELQQLAVARFRIGVLMTPDHPLAGRNELKLADCVGHSVILPKTDIATHRAIEPALRRLPQLKATIESGSIALARECARRGLGLAILSRLGSEADLAAGRLVYVPLRDRGPITSDLGVYARAGRTLPVAVDVLVNVLADGLEPYRARVSV